MPPLARVAAGVLAFALRRPKDPGAGEVLDLAEGATLPDLVAVQLNPPSADAESGGDEVRYWWSEL